MRNAIQEYLNYSDEEKKDLWDHATFVFDTNVYLNLYRYTSKTREMLLSAFEKLKDRLWMPNQVAREFMKNRIEIIWETNNQYELLSTEADKFIEQCCSSLKLDKADRELADLKEQIKGWIDNSKQKNMAVTNPDSDTILIQLLSLYDGKVGPGFTEEEMTKLEQEGQQRYGKSVPPGYKDQNKQKGNDLNNIYGDLIVWKQILRYAASEKKDIVFITNDQKEDWWDILHGQTHGPRVELRKEFMVETKQKFHMYTMRSFITRFDSGNDVKIDSTTIDEIDFFSKIIHHKSDKKNLKEYYNSFEDDREADAARIRFAIMRLENKNRKRINTINYNREKYLVGEMPAEIESMIENTIIKLERDNERIQKLKNMLQEQKTGWSIKHMPYYPEV